MIVRSHTNTAKKEQTSHNWANNVPVNFRVTVLGGITLPDGARSELGPSFSSSRPISKVSLRMVAWNHMSCKTNSVKKLEPMRSVGKEKQQVEILPIPPFSQPFYRQHDPSEEIDRKFKEFAEETFETLIHCRAT
ncbi:hypothetical protein KIN20_005823 [Parelaphostrongylus tenuis]|uniref:Uncharacterized protein n=1 Tax=Parelaphostrongylus tenuis TaxID=148309 RepID=A0AAD5MJA2_PARTN|nr:hypothetical protein KIN20_005823 [Parelaphostrongylus tenuis]